MLRPARPQRRGQDHDHRNPRRTSGRELRRSRGARPALGRERHRLAAAALVGEPELLFLDEPTTGLDPQSRRQLWDILRGLRTQGRTILITTHYMDEAERLCDRVAVVDHGKVIALGTPAQLITRLGGEHLIEFVVEDARPLDEGELRALPAVVSVRRE